MAASGGFLHTTIHSRCPRTADNLLIGWSTLLTFQAQFSSTELDLCSYLTNNMHKDHKNVKQHWTVWNINQVLLDAVTHQ